MSYKTTLPDKILKMSDRQFQDYLLKKINRKLFKDQTWSAIEERLSIFGKNDLPDYTENGQIYVKTYNFKKTS